MANLLSFGNHIEKKQTKAQYLAYEKGKVLEETIYSFIEEIPNIPEEKIISYFTKIVKKEIPVMSLVHPPAPGTLVATNQAMRSGAARA